MSDTDPNSLPDSEAPEAPLAAEWSTFDDEYNQVLGAEVTVPPGFIGQTIRSQISDPVTENRTLRELQRRVRETLSPAFPVEMRRILPGALMLEGYRRFALRSRSVKVDAYGRDPVYQRWVKPALDFLYRHWFRVEIRGLQNLPASGPAILVSNHTGALPYDASMLMHGIANESIHGRSLRPLIEDDVFHKPYFGMFLRRLGAVRACQENATRLIREGELVAVFPEGHKAAQKSFATPANLQRFGRGGFIRLALKTGAPLHPVAIVAHPTPLAKALPAELAQRPGWIDRMGVIPQPSKWTIVIGEAIDLSAKLQREERENRALIAEEAHRIRQQISETIKDILEPAG